MWRLYSRRGSLPALPLTHFHRCISQFPLPLDAGIEAPYTPSAAAAATPPSTKKKHRRTRSSGGVNAISDWQTAARAAELPRRREFGELSGLKRAAFSTEDLLLDSGHAFVWPRLSRSTSVHVGLIGLAGRQERSPEPGPADGRVAATLAQCTRAQRNFVGALLNIASKLVQYESKEVRRIQLWVTPLPLLYRNAAKFLRLCRASLLLIAREHTSIPTLSEG